MPDRTPGFQMECQNMSDIMPEKMSERMPEKMPEIM
jgi:hypothetical protein